VRDAAVAFAEVTTDYDGNPRPFGPASDIGADEYGDATTPPPPAPAPPPAPPTAADLVITSLSANAPAKVVPGGHFTVTDSIRNAGGMTARATTTRYFLSTDAVRSTGDWLLRGERSVPTLPAGAVSTKTVTVKVPGTTPAGTYVLIGCADYTRRVTEADEQNNCVSATSIQIGR
jgi:subtilase family serine protease